MPKKKTTKGKSPTKPPKPTPTNKPSVTVNKATGKASSFANLSPPLLSSINVTAATAMATRAVNFTKDSANVLVQVTTAGQTDAVPCTLNLPVGIFPLHYHAQGVGSFNVSVTGAELSHPIAGTAPDAGALLVKVS